MTFKDRWKAEHPNKLFNPFLIDCPVGYGYEKGSTIAGCIHKDLNCKMCWDREIPENIPAGTDLNSIKNPGTYVAPVPESSNLPNDTLIVPGHVNEPEGGVTVKFKKCDGEVAYGIKDSGDRTEFETGAVRDMREGKGRCDLMPLEVVAALLNKIRDGQGTVLHNVANFKNTQDTYYLYNALERFSERSGDKTDSKRYCTMLLEVAKHFEEGAKKYGENNWQKGIPVHCYIDSAIRHYLKWLRGDKDEPHDRAFVWNIMCCIWEVDYREKNKEESECNSDQ